MSGSVPTANDGLIAVDGREIDLIDRRSLEQLGHFQPLSLTRVPSPPVPHLVVR